MFRLFCILCLVYSYNFKNFTLRNIKRKYIVIQVAYKGRAVIVMKKECHKESMEGQILEEYNVTGNNDRKTSKEIIENVLKKVEE